MEKVLKDKITKEMFCGIKQFFVIVASTIIVPLIAGMNVSLALMASGVGTLIFIFGTRLIALIRAKRNGAGKLSDKIPYIPIYISSSFAFLPGIITVYSQKGYSLSEATLSIVIALAVSALVMVLMACFIIGKDKIVEKRKVEPKYNKKGEVKKYKDGITTLHSLFPVIVIAPIIIIIGMSLAFSTIWRNVISVYIFSLERAAWKSWTTVLITLAVIVILRLKMPRRSVFKHLSILIGMVVGYLWAAACGIVDVQFSGNIVVFQDIGKLWGFWGAETWKGIGDKSGIIGTAIMAIAPLTVVAFAEHYGDIQSNDRICNKIDENGDEIITEQEKQLGEAKKTYSKKSDYGNTLVGNGVANFVSAMLGGPALTTYGQSTTVLSLTDSIPVTSDTGDEKRIKNPLVWASLFMIVLSIFAPVMEILQSIPKEVLAGAGIFLFGWIAANGCKAMAFRYETDEIDPKTGKRIEKRYLDNAKNMVVLSITLAVGLGLGALSLAGEVLSDFSNTQFSEQVMQVGFLLKDASFFKISCFTVALVIGILLNLFLPEADGQMSDPNETAHKAEINVQDDGSNFEAVLFEEERRAKYNQENVQQPITDGVEQDTTACAEQEAEVNSEQQTSNTETEN